MKNEPRASLDKIVAQGVDNPFLDLSFADQFTHYFAPKITADKILCRLLFIKIASPSYSFYNNLKTGNYNTNTTNLIPNLKNLTKSRALFSKFYTNSTFKEDGTTTAKTYEIPTELASTGAFDLNSSKIPWADKRFTSIVGNRADNLYLTRIFSAPQYPADREMDNIICKVKLSNADPIVEPIGKRITGFTNTESLYASDIIFAAQQSNNIFFLERYFSFITEWNSNILNVDESISWLDTFNNDANNPNSVHGKLLKSDSNYTVNTTPSRLDQTTTTESYWEKRQKEYTTPWYGGSYPGYYIDWPSKVVGSRNHAKLLIWNFFNGTNYNSCKVGWIKDPGQLLPAINPANDKSLFLQDPMGNVHMASLTQDLKYYSLDIRSNGPSGSAVENTWLKYSNLTSTSILSEDGACFDICLSKQKLAAICVGCTLPTRPLKESDKSYDFYNGENYFFYLIIDKNEPSQYQTNSYFLNAQFGLDGQDTKKIDPRIILTDKTLSDFLGTEDFMRQICFDKNGNLFILTGNGKICLYRAAQLNTAGLSNPTQLKIIGLDNIDSISVGTNLVARQKNSDRLFYLSEQELQPFLTESPNPANETLIWHPCFNGNLKAALFKVLEDNKMVVYPGKATMFYLLPKEKYATFFTDTATINLRDKILEIQTLLSANPPKSEVITEKLKALCNSPTLTSQQVFFRDLDGLLNFELTDTISDGNYGSTIVNAFLNLQKNNESIFVTAGVDSKTIDQCKEKLKSVEKNIFTATSGSLTISSLQQIKASIDESISNIKNLLAKPNLSGNDKPLLLNSLETIATNTTKLDPTTLSDCKNNLKFLQNKFKLGSTDIPSSGKSNYVDMLASLEFDQNIIYLCDQFLMKLIDPELTSAKIPELISSLQAIVSNKAEFEFSQIIDYQSLTKNNFTSFVQEQIKNNSDLTSYESAASQNKTESFVNLLNSFQGLPTPKDLVVALVELSRRLTSKNTKSFSAGTLSNLKNYAAGLVAKIKSTDVSNILTAVQIKQFNNALQALTENKILTTTEAPLKIEESSSDLNSFINKIYNNISSNNLDSADNLWKFSSSDQSSLEKLIQAWNTFNQINSFQASAQESQKYALISMAKFFKASANKILRIGTIEKTQTPRITQIVAEAQVILNNLGTAPAKTITTQDQVNSKPDK